MRVSKNRQPTGLDGVFFKEITDDDGKIIDKVYGIRWRDENKKSRMKTLGKHSQGIRPKFCKNKLDEIVIKIRLGEDVPKLGKKAPTTTVSQLAKLYFNMKSSTLKNSDKEYRRFEKHIGLLLKDVKLINVSEEDVEKLQSKLLETLSVATVRTLFVTFNAMFKYAVKEKLFNGNIPTANIRHDKLNNARERYLSIKEIHTLLDVCYKTDYEIYFFVKLSLITGGRVGTIASIRVMDIQPDTNTLILSDHKNNDTYTGFYDDEVKEMLIKRISELSSPTDRIIRHAKSHIQYKLGAIFDVLFNQGINSSKLKVVPHTLRHTFASQLAIAGTPILTIKKLMNHKSIEMTMRYAKLAPDQGKNAVMKLYE